MKRLFFMVTIIILFCSCVHHAMSNDEIIKETKKCEDSGMKAKVLHLENGSIWKVVCEPK